MNCDNKFGECCNCPGLMSDGRFITSYISTPRLVANLKEMNNITDENEFRLFLQKNGTSLISKQKEFLLKNKSCDFSKK
jgi:hypothetical protein